MDQIQNVFKYEDFDNFEQQAKNIFKVWHKTQLKFYSLKTISLENMEKIVFLWDSIQKSPKPSLQPDYFGLIQEENTENYHLCFNYFPLNLKNLIESQKSNSTLFSFKKILDFAEKLINGLAFLQSLGVYNEELLPENILFDELQETPIIIDLCRCEIQEIKVNDDLSPEIDEAFNETEKKSVDFNRFKSDTFTLALILLEMGTLEGFMKEKDSNACKKKIKEMLAKFAKNYENEEEKTLKKFLRILKKCLRFDPKRRPDFIDLFYRFQGKILKREESLRAQINACEEFLQKKYKKNSLSTIS